MRLQMLLGISPQCLYHNIRMILIEKTVHPRRFLEETYYYWFACPVLDCNQRYDMGHGYYTLIDGKLDATPNNQACPECSLRLYVAKLGATLADSVWLCANENCPSNKRKTRTT
jgi:hypothetical protein